MPLPRKRPRFKQAFIPMEGSKASYHDVDSDYYGDVHIYHMYHGGKTAKVFYVKDPKKTKFIVNVSLLEPPLEPGVEDRFKYFADLAELTLKGAINALFVSGKGGLGKTFTTQQVIKMLELEEDTDYIWLSGTTSPYALYRVLRDNPDQNFIFDDFDSAFTDKKAANILKAVLDTYAVRKVSWLTTEKGGDNDRRAQSFNFSGSVIFLSNLSKDDVPGAILSRSAIVDLHMTPAEIIERMHQVVHTLDVGTSLDDNEKREVLDLLDKYKYTINNLNIRTLRKALKVYESNHDLGLVRYQILNS